ncbi:hypothetical protein [Pendulispora albinea]|uniref:Tetratricopeptide repeat protein n=1 Tax=Pendulispora albinea TaxID=2741071 RepID=A0ABZ2M326_9BACT
MNPIRFRTTYRMLFVASLAAGAAVTAPASAQSRSTASSKIEKRAEARNDEGKRAFKQSDFDGASRAFSEAYKLDPKSKYLLNLALAELRGNKPLDALGHFRQYRSAPGISADEVDKTRGYFEEAMARTGHLRIHAPSDLAVTLDAAPLSKEQREETVDVVAGKHVVEVAYTTGTKRRDVDAPAGKEVIVEFPAPPPPPAPVPLPAAPPVAVQTPPPETAPAADRRESGLGCTHSGACLGLTVGLATLGVAGFVGLGVFQTQASSATTDAEAIRARAGSCNGNGSAECGQLADLQDQHSSKLTLARVSAGVGAASLVGAGLLFFLWPKPAKGPSAQAYPLVAPNAAGMGIRGSF